MLNAFRHHWNLHTQPKKRIGLGYLKRAQRLSASLESSLEIVEGNRLRYLVLNAFRHHWNLHAGAFGCFSSGSSCSTPFGIIGIFTSISTLAPVAIEGAQRLSASLESSLGLSYMAIPVALGAQRLSASLESSRTFPQKSGSAFKTCSTPFGIIGIFTPLTPWGVLTNRSAQRLSASLESSLRQCEYHQHNAHRHRAQRLSASLESSPADDRDRTPPGCRGAQRLSASLESSRGLRIGNRRPDECSTPFGIIGIFTFMGPSSNLAAGDLCSTPFGIIGIFTGATEREG